MQEKVKVVKEVCTRIPNHYGDFELCLYSSNKDAHQHLAMTLGDVKGLENVMVRVHSECFTGETLGSKRCDCGEQLDLAMQMIVEEGGGVLIYLRQEGRGIGLLEKLRAYNLQDKGFDTVDANLELGHQADNREYSIATEILKDLEIKSIRLLTNNPSKIERLEKLRVIITERLSVPPTVTSQNHKYLQTKVQKMRHMLDLSDFEEKIESNK